MLLEMGTSSAFYTFISARAREAWFFALYGVWLAFQFVATMVVVELLPQVALGRIWLGHGRSVVLLACAASFLTGQAWAAVSQLGEAIRKTALVQALSTLQAVAHLVLIVLVTEAGWLTVGSVMWFLVIEYATLVVILGPRLGRANLQSGDAGGDRSVLLREFATYCGPLVVYAWVSFLYAFADRWLLQRFGGAAQQGFFAVGQQFANVSLLATASMLRVFWKEVAAARANSDVERARRLYATVSRGLYFVSAWASCLLIPYSREILRWTVGRAYEGAWPTLALMLLFPIHQSLGQINGTFFYASNDTSRYARIGLVMMLVSLPVTYLMLASPSAAVPGLSLGAVGLTFKMVGLQVIGVNWQGVVIARSLGAPFRIAYQASTVVGLLALGFACKTGAEGVLGAVGFVSPVLALALGAVLYVSSSSFVLWERPGLVGVTREQLGVVMSRAIGRGRPVTI